MNLIPTDELNRLSLTSYTSEREVLEDEILDLLILSYTYGNEDAKEMLGESNPVKVKELEESIYKKTAGKTFIERLNEGSDIARLAETEAHRVYNEALMNSSKGIANFKEWKTMEDDLVRDPHRILDGQKIPYDAYFYVDGDKALAPNGFNSAELNVNCRCYLLLTK